MSSLMRGDNLLTGNNTIPGVSPPKEVKDLVPVILQKCRDFGLDFWPTVVEFLDYSEISEVAAYGGFPVRYPHWKWGMEYEDLSKGYEHGIHRISEMVINTNPCYIYCLNSNTLVDNIMVIAHATGHNDFFKNNVRFKHTQSESHNMMNTLANHATRIRRYMSRWGKEKVTEFLDYAMRLETLVDAADAWKQKHERTIRDKRKYFQPRRVEVPEGHDYMEDWINPQAWRDKENKRIQRKEAANELSIFKRPTRDIMGFLLNNAPLKTWEADILAMLYEESVYFAPQRSTKMLNEGFASWIDYKIMAEGGCASLGQDLSGAGIIEYSKHKAGVLGGKYSMNPYKIGFYLLLDIEERWNKGRFGEKYKECNDISKRENWDTDTGLGKKKVFEVRKYYDDVTAIHEFFTADFCNKHEFFEWERRPNGEYIIVNKNPAHLKQKMMLKYLNGGLPDIRLVDPNHRGEGSLLLQHEWDGRPLYEPYVRETLTGVQKLWTKRVLLSTKNKDGEERICIVDGPDAEQDITWLTREEHDGKV